MIDAFFYVKNGQNRAKFVQLRMKIAWVHVKMTRLREENTRSRAKLTLI